MIIQTKQKSTRRCRQQIGGYQKGKGEGKATWVW